VILISPAIMIKHIYHPSSATTNSSPPPAFWILPATSYSPCETFQYAADRTQQAVVTSRKMAAKTALILQVKTKKVKRAKPQTIRYRATVSLNSGLP